MVFQAVVFFVTYDTSSNPALVALALISCRSSEFTGCICCASAIIVFLAIVYDFTLSPITLIPAVASTVELAWASSGALGKGVTVIVT